MDNNDRYRIFLLGMRDEIDKTLAAIDKGSQPSGGTLNEPGLDSATSQPVGEAGPHKHVMFHRRLHPLESLDRVLGLV